MIYIQHSQVQKVKEKTYYCFYLHWTHLQTITYV